MPIYHTFLFLDLKTQKCLLNDILFKKETIFIPCVTPLGGGGDFKRVYWLIFSHWRQAIERDNGIPALSPSSLSRSGPEVSGFALPFTFAVMHYFTTDPKYCASCSWTELYKM
jgi:hypothetical protein